MSRAHDGKIGEISRMKGKITDIESALKEQRKSAGKLRENQEKKLYELALLDEEIAETVERCRWKKTHLEKKKDDIRLSGDVDIKFYVEKQLQLLSQSAGLDSLEMENDRLHKKLKTVSLQYDTIRKHFETETEEKNERDFKVRMQMEESMRKVLRSNVYDYKKEAVAKMLEEASFAKAENVTMRSEYEGREKQAEELVRQQAKSFDMLKQIKIERELAASLTDFQTIEIGDIKNAIACIEIDNQALEYQIECLRREISEKRLDKIKRNEGEKKLSELRKEIKNKEDKKAALRQETISLGRNLLKCALLITEKSQVLQATKVANLLANA